MPRQLTESFQRECNEREDRYFQIYDHYRPNYYKPIVTGKFYSKYDRLDLSLANMDLVNDIKRVRDLAPRDKYPWPETESQTYGWFDQVVLLDRNDRRFYAPQKMSDFVKHEVLLKLDRSMQKPKFTGIPFKL